MKYAFVQRHRHAWPVSVQCRVLQVSAAGYHAYLARQASDAQRRHLSDEALLVHIKALHAETRGAYGWPRIWRELVARGVAVGKERVQKLMQLHGIRAKGKRRFKVTTDSNHKLPISANLLDREFAVAGPDKVWVGDITYIATDEGWLLLAVVIDLFSRQVVGWSLREDMTSNIVIGTTATASQLEFINLIVQYLTENGLMNKARLYESPFTDISQQGPEALFLPVRVTELVRVLDEIL